MRMKAVFARGFQHFTSLEQDVEILAFDVYKSPVLLCEARTIDSTRLITFLNHRNSENS